LEEEILPLGHTIGAKRLMATEIDISATENNKIPLSKRKMWGFLSLAGYKENIS
jgi:hypothetical protein